MTDKIQIPEITDLEACVEALLFAAAEPVSPGKLALVLDNKTREIEKSLIRLEKYYLKNHYLRLMWNDGRVQLTTAPIIALSIEKLLGLQIKGMLSKAALETLAIVAYRQPITRPRIDNIRGVNSDGVLRSLLRKGLLQDMGRGEGPGRPILYSLTMEFLQYFGLSSVKDLPPLNMEEEPSTTNQEVTR